MGFSSEDSHVRIDFFRPNKWYSTEELIWTGPYSEMPIYTAFAISLRDHLKGSRSFDEMRVVCLDPHHEYAHPLIGVVGELLKLCPKEE